MATFPHVGRGQLTRRGQATFGGGRPGSRSTRRRRRRDVAGVDAEDFARVVTASAPGGAVCYACGSGGVPGGGCGLGEGSGLGTGSGMSGGLSGSEGCGSGPPGSGCEVSLMRPPQLGTTCIPLVEKGNPNAQVPGRGQSYRPCRGRYPPAIGQDRLAASGACREDVRTLDELVHVLLRSAASVARWLGRPSRRRQTCSRSRTERSWWEPGRRVNEGRFGGRIERVCERWARRGLSPARRPIRAPIPQARGLLCVRALHCTRLLAARWTNMRGTPARGRLGGRGVAQPCHDRERLGEIWRPSASRYSILHETPRGTSSGPSQDIRTLTAGALCEKVAWPSVPGETESPTWTA